MCTCLSDLHNSESPSLPELSVLSHLPSTQHIPSSINTVAAIASIVAHGSRDDDDDDDEADDDDDSESDARRIDAAHVLAYDATKLVDTSITHTHKMALPQSNAYDVLSTMSQSPAPGMRNASSPRVLLHCTMQASVRVC